MTSEATIDVDPRHDRGPRVWAALSFTTLALFFAGLLLQVVSMDRRLNVYDEGLIVYGASAVMHGEMPYRDFWSLYGPGQYYLLAGLFKIFGASIAVERAWDAIVRAGISLLTYLFVRRFGSRSIAILAWAMSGVFLSTFRSPGFPVFPATLFSLLSAYLLISFFEGAASRWALFVSGFCIGIATLFRHDLGCYVFLADTIALMLFVWPAPKHETPFWRTLGRNAQPLIAFYVGVFVVCAPVALLLLWVVPLHDLLFDLFIAPVKIYPSFRSLPFPSVVGNTRDALRNGDGALVFELSVYLPFLIAGACLLLWKYLAWRPVPAAPGVARTMSPVRCVCLLLLVLAMMFYIKGIVRVSAIHMAPSIIVALVLFFILVRYWMLAPLGRRLLTLLVALCVAVISASALGGAVLHLSDNVAAIADGSERALCNPSPALEAMKCFETDDSRRNAMQYVVEHSSANDTIYVGAARHDKLFVNDIIFYFVTRRQAATKWYQEDPGIQTTTAVQLQVIADLTARKPRFVVLDSQWDGVREPNASAVSSAVMLLDDFIKRRYRPVALFGPITILEDRK